MKNNTYKKINDYAIIGNGHTAALIALDGSIDWLCWPRFDSPSLFGALLHSQNGGFWNISPEGTFSSHRKYQGNSMVLKTTFICNTGTAVLTDCMPIQSERLEKYLAPEQELCRYIECLSGSISIKTRFSPSPDYGSKPVALKHFNGGLRFNCSIGLVLLRSECELDEKGIGHIELKTGQSIAMSLTFARDTPAVLVPLGSYTKDVIDATADAWSLWADKCTFKGPYFPQVIRSALILKSLIYAPSGAVVAAATTSLPERITGTLNWDYRFCWLRDAALTVRALKGLGFHDEANAFASWLLHTTRLTRPRLQPLYDVYGGLTSKEKILPWLDGYMASIPVRIGNAASKQLQLDIYGELISAVVQCITSEGPSDKETKMMLLDFGKYICQNWDKPDEGIWEPREGPSQHTSSKVLCWAGLNRLINLQESHLLPDKYNALFNSTIKTIHDTVENNCFNQKVGAYVQNDISSTIDISILLMSWHGFKNPTTDRLQSTFRTIKERLDAGHGLFFRNEQSLTELEGAFGICSFWVAEFFAKGGGTLSEAEKQFEDVVSFANDVCLFSEEIDPETGDFLGNFPQAFTHIGLINAALSIEERRLKG